MVAPHEVCWHITWSLMPSHSVAQQQLFGIARSIQEGKEPANEASPAARRIAHTMSPKGVHDFAATKHKGLPKHAAVERLAVALLIVKKSEYANSLKGVEGALHNIHTSRAKVLKDFSSTLQKENENLRKEVTNASEAAQSAAQAAQKAQTMSDVNAQAAQMQQTGQPPASQPPYGSMAIGPTNDGSQEQNK